MNQVLRFFRARAENLAAAMLAAMFVTFLLQIGSRYLLHAPIGWTLELCLILWVWIVFFGCAFIVDERDHVTFDLLYIGVSTRTQRLFALVSAVAIVIGFAVALYPTWDYIDFLKIKKSPQLKIPLRTVFSIYAVFMVAVIAIYLWRIIRLVREPLPPAKPHHPEIAEE